MAFYVLTHGVGLIALALLTYRVSPEIARVTLITGLAGGTLCVFWGVLGLLGYRRRVGTVITLIPVCLVLITQAIGCWMERVAGESESLSAPILMTAMLVASVGMLMYSLHGNRSPEFYLPESNHLEDSRARGSHSHSSPRRHKAK